MDETKWTPGPWELNKYGGYIEVQQVDPDGICIAIMTAGSEADARLIAAAPAMADALRDWVDFFDQLEAQSDPDDPLARARAMYHDQRIRKSRAALAAAEGTGGV